MCRNPQRQAELQEPSHQDHSTVRNGSFNTHTACVAFVKGVALLSYMLRQRM